PGFEVPSGWDGGAILPGETLSRHRRPESRESRQESRAEHRSDSQTILRNDNQQQASATQAPEAVEAEPIEQAVEHTPILVPPAEYEPTDASASYRVDPAAPSEFRQSASTIEQPAEHTAEHTEQPAAHEFTAIHATGEMETEPPIAAFTPAQEAESASPLQHETVIANPAENAVEDGI